MEDASTPTDRRTTKEFRSYPFMSSSPAPSFAVRRLRCRIPLFEDPASSCSPAARRASSGPMAVGRRPCFAHPRRSPISPPREVRCPRPALSVAACFLCSSIMALFLCLVRSLSRRSLSSPLPSSQALRTMVRTSDGPRAHANQPRSRRLHESRGAYDRLTIAALSRRYNVRSSHRASPSTASSFLRIRLYGPTLRQRSAADSRAASMLAICCSLARVMLLASRSIIFDI